MTSITRSHEPTLVYTDVDSGALKVRRWAVRVLNGPQAGLSVTLERGSLLVGSAGSNDLVLEDPCVSRAHMELRLLEKGLQVRDLGSSNGTFHQETRIKESILQGAAVLRVGGTEVAVEPADREVPIDTDLQVLGEMVGVSAPMRKLFGMVRQIAPSDVSVLIEGETGTGKEMVAVEIHRLSDRADKPLVVVDCGALPSGLVESELFGHMRGSFTGAHTNREGAFEQADGGTIFLDEIGELPTELQPKLLRALDQGQVKRVGDNTMRKVNVRAFAATSRDLNQAVSKGGFRADLFYRLAVVRLRVPPLRERLVDIKPLSQAILRRITSRDIVVPDSAVELLRVHAWPGNVRELRNVLSHAVALHSDSDILKLPEVLGTEDPPDGAEEPALEGDYREAKRQAVNQFEVRYLTNLLSRHNWNVSAAAREAGVDRNYIHRLMKRHDIRRP
jgi:transcriptional regulator with GAF, ATPase, and Fis domain